MAAMSHWTVGWLAPVAFVGAVGFAACSDDGQESTRTESVEAVGSDRHLENQADDVAARQGETVSVGLPNPWEAGNRAAERALAASRAPVPADDFVPGTRHMPSR
jgi:hypothetical protein